MSELLEFVDKLEVSNKQSDFFNSYLDFHLEYDLIFEKDVDDIKKIFNSFNEYRINETHKESDSLKYILNNINKIKQKEINGIKFLKKPTDYVKIDTKKSMHPDRCVFKLENSVFKIHAFQSKGSLCWNWNKINSFSTEIYFQKLSKKLIKNSEIKDMVIVPEIYNYGIIKMNGRGYMFLETEYIEDILSSQLRCSIKNIEESTNILFNFLGKYKKYIGYINKNLCLYCMDDANCSKYIFSLSIEDISTEIEKLGLNKLLEKLYITTKTDSFITSDTIFHSNTYISQDDKLVLIDFDSYTRKELSKYSFFRLFDIIWRNEIIKNWE